jgi:monoterpene epsilon-lactone hydrolase
MQNWPMMFSARASRSQAPRLTHQTSPEALRAQYHALCAFEPAPGDVGAERAHIGQVKGEWVRVAESEPQRLLLYFHGGGYVAGSAEGHRPLVAKLCRAAGAAALSVDYRLGPEFPFPAALRDAVDAYRFLTTKAFDPGCIVLAGDGAGGGLAMATAMAARNGGMPMPAGVIALSPWADLTLSGWSIMRNAETDSSLTWDLLFVSARNYLNGANPADPYASPVFGSMRDFPPIMVHAGSREILRDDASRLGELAAAANVPVSVEVYDGMQHLFQGSSVPEAKVSLNRLGQFIRTRTSAHADAAAGKPRRGA